MNVAVGIALALALAAPAGAQTFPNPCTPDRDCTNAPMLSTIADESTPTPPVDELLEEHPGGPLNDWSNPLLNRKWTPRPKCARRDRKRIGMGPASYGRADSGRGDIWSHSVPANAADTAITAKPSRGFGPRGRVAGRRAAAIPRRRGVGRACLGMLRSRG
jgi:hypothetical protein